MIDTYVEKKIICNIEEGNYFLVLSPNYFSKITYKNISKIFLSSRTFTWVFTKSDNETKIL